MGGLYYLWKHLWCNMCVCRRCVVFVPLLIIIWKLLSQQPQSAIRFNTHCPSSPPGSLAGSVQCDKQIENGPSAHLTCFYWRPVSLSSNDNENPCFSPGSKPKHMTRHFCSAAFATVASVVRPRPPFQWEWHKAETGHWGWIGFNWVLGLWAGTKPVWGQSLSLWQSGIVGRVTR